MKLNLKSKQFLKKSAAVCTAALLSVTAAPVSAFAEGTYNELVKNAWTEAIANFTAEYARSFEEYDMLKSGMHEDMTLTLDDAGRSLLGFMVPVDISWFEELNFSSDVTIAEDGEFMNAGLYLNGTKICTMEYYLDFDNLDIYMKFPEFHDGYLKMNYADSITQSQAELEAEIQAMEENGSTPEEIEEFAKFSEELTSGITSPEFFKTLLQITGDLPAFMPEASVVEELLNKYTGIFFDHVAEADASEETIALESISDTLTVYEGQLNDTAATAMMQEILDTAKSDEQLKELLNFWDEKLPNVENLYQSFLDMLEECSVKLNEEEINDALYLSSKIYVNKDGEIVGKDLSFTEEDNTTPLYNLLTLRDEENYESRFLFGPADDGFSLTGSGQISGSTLNGAYTLSVNDTPTASIEVRDYDTEATKNGCFNGSFEITPIAAVGENESYNMLQNFSLITDIASERDSGTFDLTLASAGVSLGRLSIAANMGAAVEKPDTADFTDVYNLTDEAAFNEYMSTMDFETILDNLRTAGVPEELITAALSGGAPEEGYEDNESLTEDPFDADAAA